MQHNKMMFDNHLEAVQPKKITMLQLGAVAWRLLREWIRAAR